MINNLLPSQEVISWWQKENLEIPQFEIVKQDISVSKHNGTTPRINAFQGLYSPIQYYCRLIDVGYDKHKALEIASRYKEECYNLSLQNMVEETK